jgi:hypothetical protein
VRGKKKLMGKIERKVSRVTQAMNATTLTFPIKNVMVIPLILQKRTPPPESPPLTLPTIKKSTVKKKIKTRMVTSPR